MSSEIIFNSYLATQATLLISWLGFRLVKKTLPGTGNKTWLRTSQIILVVAFILPGVTFFSEFRHHKISFKDVPTFKESYGRKVVFTARTQERLLSFVQPEIVHQHSSMNVARQMTFDDLMILLLFLIGFSVLVRKVRQFSVLLRLLRSATVFHSIGKMRIVVSDQIVVPFAMTTLRKTWVAIPMEIFGNPRDFRVATGHELQHVRQGDPLFALAIDFLICLFGPGLKLWKSEIIELQELSCDEALIGRKKISPHDYGSCLLRVAEAALGRGSLYVGTTCMAADPRNPKSFKSFLRRRIEMFTEYKDVRRTGLRRRVMGTSFVLVCSMIALAAGAALKPSQIAPINPGKTGFDPAIQKIAEAHLKKAVSDDAKLEGGFAVIEDSSTGRVLAAATFEKEKSAMTGNWALSQLVEPASVLKTLILAEGLEKKAFKLDDSFDCGKGNYQVGAHVHHDWRKFDQLSAKDIIIWSSNIGTIRLAEKLGPQAVSDSIKNFGFGSRGSSSDFPGARVGYLAPVETEKGSQWLPLTAAGYSTLFVSPLEMVQAYSAIANGGNLLKPLAYDSEEKSPQVIRRVMSEATAAQVREVLGEAATSGTGSNHGVSVFYTSGGKTGTNYSPKVEQHDSVFGGEKNMAHYIGFAPLKQPKITVYVGLMGADKTILSGSRTAAPVFKEIIDRVLHKLNVAPDQTETL